jgi:hypothetical protein
MLDFRLEQLRKTTDTSDQSICAVGVLFGGGRAVGGELATDVWRMAAAITRQPALDPGTRTGDESLTHGLSRETARDFPPRAKSAQATWSHIHQQLVRVNEAHPQRGHD